MRALRGLIVILLLVAASGCVPAQRRDPRPPDPASFLIGYQRRVALGLERCSAR